MWMYQDIKILLELTTRRENVIANQPCVILFVIHCMNDSNLSNFPKIFLSSPNTVQTLYIGFRNFLKINEVVQKDSG